MILNLQLDCVFLIFIASANGWIFRTTYCGFVDWPSNWEHGSNGPTYDTKIYSCDVTVERSGNFTSLVEVVGNHSDGKTNSDVEGIRINNSSTLTSMPSNIGNFLPNLISINIRAEQITSVTAEDLKQFPELLFLAIYVCPIVSLDADLLKYTPKLQAFIVPSNQIRNVGEDLLTNLVDLKFVNFLSNPCLSYYASNPQQLEWLKNNLPLRCPPILTTTQIQTLPTTTTTTPTTTTPTTTTPTTTTPTTTTQTITTSSLPVEDCKLRCSLNEEIDELKQQLLQQGTLIRDLFEIVSNYSQRLFELEKFDAKVTSAIILHCCN